MHSGHAVVAREGPGPVGKRPEDLGKLTQLPCWPHKACKTPAFAAGVGDKLRGGPVFQPRGDVGAESSGVKG